MNWFPFTYILDNLITNSIHALLTKDYSSPGMSKEYHACSFTVGQSARDVQWDPLRELKHGHQTIIIISRIIHYIFHSCS